MQSRPAAGTSVQTSDYVTVALHEYDALRNEIVTKMDAHNRIFSWAIVLITGVGYLGFTNWSNSPQASLVSSLSFAVLLPLIGMSFYFAHQMSSAQATRSGDYLFWLETKLSLLGGPPPTTLDSAIAAFVAPFKVSPERHAADAITHMKAYLPWPMAWEHWIRRKSWGVPRQGSLGWDGVHLPWPRGPIRLPVGALAAGIGSCGLGVLYLAARQRGALWFYCPMIFAVALMFGALVHWYMKGIVGHEGPLPPPWSAEQPS